VIAKLYSFTLRGKIIDKQIGQKFCLTPITARLVRLMHSSVASKTAEVDHAWRLWLFQGCVELLLWLNHVHDCRFMCCLRCYL